MSLRIDLHTHSNGSPDGGLTTSHYQRMLESGRLDYIAITDHGSIDAARRIQDEIGTLGSRIIIGEEIKTTDGEIIGLYLESAIPEGMTPRQTVQAIRSQGGLVYIPHPFETVRSGISPAALEEIANTVDIIEIINGRAVFQNKSNDARTWQKKHHVAGAASSDAHGWHGWGKTYSTVQKAPTPQTLMQELDSATYSAFGVGLGILYPKYHRVRRKIVRP